MRLLWSLAAQDDVFDIAEHYDGFDPALADEMVRRIETASFPLADFAHLGERVQANASVRKRTVAGTPFVLLYLVTDAGVEVQRVVHVASDWRP